MLGWLRLIRVPNLATAIADPLAGFLIVGGYYRFENLSLGGWLAIAASLCLYAVQYRTTITLVGSMLMTGLDVFSLGRCVCGGQDYVVLYCDG